MPQLVSFIFKVLQTKKDFKACSLKSGPGFLRKVHINYNGNYYFHLYQLVIQLAGAACYKGLSYPYLASGLVKFLRKNQNWSKVVNL
jgi:hypothetical protein